MACDFSEYAAAVPAFPQLPAGGGNVVSVGIDIESVERVQTAIARHGDVFLKKVFTPAEIAYCNGLGETGRRASFAARWAAKEAFSKALGTGIGETFSLADAGVLNDEKGAPFFSLSPKAGAALRSRGASSALVSMSHTRVAAAAIVVFLA